MNYNFTLQHYPTKTMRHRTSHLAPSHTTCCGRPRRPGVCLCAVCAHPKSHLQYVRRSCTLGRIACLAHLRAQRLCSSSVFVCCVFIAQVLRRPKATAHTNDTVAATERCACAINTH